MKYSDLIAFEPVEEVIELRRADDEETARHLVETFVVSERLASQLEDVVLPHLQFSEPRDNKGLLVVGNYGTGKSHLMALLSAVAEHADLAASINNTDVAETAEAIAGKFKVIRLEIGGVEMRLRDIICGHLEDELKKFGVNYTFPPIDQVRNNKEPLTEMMAAFHERYPDQGLLLVVDELLDYLRSRKDQNFVLDLGFLREVGEICKTTRFRFMAGVQESLFDNPEFQFVSDSLRRVKDRFEQLRIAREDVEYVVAERLLKKSPEQEGRIREHLQRFAPLYGSMNERLDDYVRLFPVHPSYIETFEQVYVAEKREVLKTLSRSIRALIDDTVPEDRPGVISYDDYWSNLVDNPSFRSLPEIKEVVDRSGTIESLVKNGFPREDRKPVAKRIIHGLSVHRLTTKDIHAPVGPTADQLRDDLCLLLPGVPEQDAEFLHTLVEKVLKDIITTANGQFISFNPENGQYYLDLKKDIDFDAQIEKRAATLGEAMLDRYYFDALREVVLEDPSAKHYVPGFQIWEHDLEWRSKKTERTGYLFFGAPNQRSTAQPPRDFYVYFLQPFDPPRYDEQKNPDEVFFELAQRDDEFVSALSLYAGARLQADSASGSNKRIYQEKAEQHLKRLVKWLREHMTTAYQVTYRGDSTTLAERVQGKLHPGESESVRDLINAASSICLESHFEDLAPEYPDFAILITRQNREQAAQEAVRWLGGGIQSKQGTAVLDGLRLLDGGELKPRQSPYAKDLLDRLEKKGEGQVLNRSEILEEDAGIEYWQPRRFRLEPELLSAVIATLVHAGEVVLSLPGEKLNAGDTERFAAIGIGSLKQFKHIEPPRDLPVGPLKTLFRLLGLQEGLLTSPATHQQAAAELAKAASAFVKRVVEASATLTDGVSLWGHPLLSKAERDQWTRRLQEAKQFLEQLQPYNTAGKLKNFRFSSAEVDEMAPDLEVLLQVEALRELVGELQPLTSYLETGEAVLPGGHPWIEELKTTRTDVLKKIEPTAVHENKKVQQVRPRLGELKREYQKAYIDLHKMGRLGAGEDDRKKKLNTDRRVAQLRKLASVPGMPKQKLDHWNEELLALKTCFSLADTELDSRATCPHCEFRPVEEPDSTRMSGAVLEHLEDRLERMVEEWTESLLTDLDDPLVEPSIQLLEEGPGREALLEFRATKELPDPVESEFVQALQTVLEGLEGVAVTPEQLYAAISDGGARCTVPQLQERFDTFVADVTKGKDRSKIRIVLQ